MEKSPKREGFSKSERKGNSREENFPNSIQDFQGENSEWQLRRPGQGIAFLPNRTGKLFPEMVFSTCYEIILSNRATIRGRHSCKLNTGVSGNSKAIRSLIFLRQAAGVMTGRIFPAGVR